MSQSPTGAERSSTMDRYARAWAATNLLTRQGRSFSGHEEHCCFLNTGSGRFADVSATVGLNLPEDGRSLAVVDWDFDGDLDLWITNRTAPRVRFFRNDFPNRQHFVTFRLQGRTCNRDAIGARLELYLAGPEPSKRIKTLHAGDGFLGQSSKTVHFGLGSNDKIDRLVVHWPGRNEEEFRDLKVDQHYAVVQGTGQAAPWRPPRGSVELAPSRIDVPPLIEEARIVLVGRVPLPDAPYLDSERNPASLVEHRRGPLLVNLWASWCRPCLNELQEITRHQQDVQHAGLDVVALSVDALDESSTPDSAERILHRLTFPFTAGAATAELVAALDAVQQTWLDRKRPLPVPSSFLVDGEGQIAVIYKGPVAVEQVLRDLERMEASPATRRDLAVPFAGRWIAAPATSDPLQIAGALVDSGYPELAARYAEQLIEYFSKGSASRYISDSARSQRIAGLYAFRGSILLGQEKLEDAAGAFQTAVKLSPRDRGSHVQLGQVFTKLARTDEAARHFQMALDIDGDDADTHYNLAINLTELGRHREAVAHYWDVLRLRPGWPPAANNLAWILATHPDASIRDGARAVELAEEVCRKVSYQDPTGLDTLAAAQAESGQLAAAIRTIRRAIEMTESRNDKATARKLKDRLRLYEAGHPYRDPNLRG